MSLVSLDCETGSFMNVYPSMVLVMFCIHGNDRSKQPHGTRLQMMIKNWSTVKKLRKRCHRRVKNGTATVCRRLMRDAGAKACLL